MNNNNLNINDLNNVQQPKLSEQPELTEQITPEESQYRYLKELNKKVTLFKKQDKQSRKKNEEIKQIIRR